MWIFSWSCRNEAVVARWNHSSIANFSPCEHKYDRERKKDWQFNESARRSQKEFYRFVCMCVFAFQINVWWSWSVRTRYACESKPNVRASTDVTRSHKLNKNQIYFFFFLAFSLSFSFFIFSFSDFSLCAWCGVMWCVCRSATSHTKSAPMLSESFYYTLYPLCVSCSVVPKRFYDMISCVLMAC